MPIENQSESPTPQQNNEPKPKTYWLAKLAACCFWGFFLMILILMAILIIFESVSSREASEDALDILFIIPSIAFIASPIIAIIALIKMYRSPSTIQGKSMATTVIVLFTLLFSPMTLMFMLSNIKVNVHKELSQNSLKCINNSIRQYAADNNGRLPEPQSWCDTLIIDSNAVSEIFYTSTREHGESIYALNKNVTASKLNDLPPDIVLIFETITQSDTLETSPLNSKAFSPSIDKEDLPSYPPELVHEKDWNKVSGPNSLKITNYFGYQGCNFLFANGDINFVKLEKIPKLRWKLHGKEYFPASIFPEDNIFRKVIIVTIIVLSLLVIAAIILYKYLKKQNITFALISALFSASVAGGIGYMVKSSFLIDYFPTAIVITLSTIGFVIGLCYAAIITSDITFLKHQRSVGYNTSLGMAAGIIAFIFSNFILSIYYPTTVPIYLAVLFIPQGIIIGSLIGWINSRVLYAIYYKPNKNPEIITSD